MGSRRADEQPTPRWLSWLIAVIAVVAVSLGISVTWTAGTAEDANLVLQGEKSAVEGQRDAAVGQSVDLASQVQQACTTGVLESDDPLCTRAAEVRAQPIPGGQGAMGETGAAGRGIVSTNIDPRGHLLVTYTDGTTDDVGVVAGAAGVDGTDGQDGRGITSTTLADGRLIITFTDGQAQDVGPVVGSNGAKGVDGRDGRDGADGRGVASVAQVGGQLIVTYTDGSTQDIGPLPQAPQAPERDPEPACPRDARLAPYTFSDGADGYRCVLDVQPDARPDVRPAEPPAADQQQPDPPAVPDGEGDTGG